MVAVQRFHNLGVPGFSETQYFEHREILDSEARFTQIPGIMASGQGIVLAGTVIGIRTSDKKVVVYNNAAGNGTEVARGVLRDSVDTSGGDQQVMIVTSGILKNSMLSGLDASAITDLNARVDTVFNTVTL